MRDGRPLRFLAATFAGWTAFRVAALWPAATPTPPLALPGPAAPAEAAPAEAKPLSGRTESGSSRLATARSERQASSRAVQTVGGQIDTVPSLRKRQAPAPARPTALPPKPISEDVLGPPLCPTPTATGPGRLAGSAWLLVRGGPNGTLSGGQLGASQAGVRLTYALGDARRLAVAARLATPLAGRGMEAAIGIDWKPTRLPAHLIAEQRFVLGGGKGGPTLGIIGGYGPGMVAPGVRIEAYGQAGAIARNGIEGFVDAAARATHPAITRGPVRLDIGAGIWGSAQRGAARLDLGPTIGAVVPVGRRSLRLAFDWRERVAGDARPGSGPAFTIGSDF